MPWLALLQRQKDAILGVKTSKDTLSVDHVGTLAKYLIGIDDGLATKGLVDYQMGVVWEEEIICGKVLLVGTPIYPMYWLRLVLIYFSKSLYR